MSESNPQTPFTGLGGSLGCMVHSQRQKEGEKGDGWMDKLMDRDGRWRKKTDKGEKHRNAVKRVMKSRERSNLCFRVNTCKT